MTGKIPQPFIEELVTRADIVDVIESRVPLKKAGREYTGLCPFHSEKTPSFTVSPQKQFYHCFGCGAHGTVLGFLMEYERLSFPEAVADLARQLGLTVPQEAAAAAAPESDLYGPLNDAAGFFRQQLKRHPEAPRAIAYLKERGLDGETAQRFGIGLAPSGWDNLLRALGGNAEQRRRLIRAGLLAEREDGRCYDRFRARIMFPIRNRRGRVIGFGGRVYDGGEPKYLNSPETPVFHKGRELYGLYEARQAQAHPERLVVVEGYMDVVALAQHGVSNAVATLGTAVTEDQVAQLYRVAPEVVFCFDGDNAGRRAAARALEAVLPALKDGRQARFLFLPEGEDPDSLVRAEGRAGFERRLAAATPLSDWFFERIADGLDTASLDDRARLVERAKPLLARLPEGVFRDMMRERLARTAHFDPEKLSIRAEPAPRRAAQAPRPADRTKQRPSLVRHAVGLLLHRPELAQTVDEDTAWLRDTGARGAALLADLVELLRAKPHLTTAGVLEHWRDTPEGRHLHALAEAEWPGTADTLAQEFKDTLVRLRDLWVRRRWDFLIKESSRRPLTEVEKTELKALHVHLR